jgi:putative oxidoreductase
MNQFSDLLNRLNRNQDIGYSIIRIFLGIILFIRGWAFAANPDIIFEIAGDPNVHMWYSYITVGHLVGGCCLALGILSRVAALIQIPILMGAVLISEKGLMMGMQSLELASLVLFLLVLFTLFGSGPLAVSTFVNKRNKGDRSENLAID